MSTEQSSSRGAAEHEWVVVTQVKSHRVVYFTDDTDYVAPMHADWYYVSPFKGVLPKGMSLRNCWRWRFNGMEFVDAGAAPAKKREETLLQNNKTALVALLRARVDAARRAAAIPCTGGAELHELRKREARAVLEEGAAAQALQMLPQEAAAHLCGLEAYARKVLDDDRRRLDVLLMTEAERVTLEAAIERSTTNHELAVLRARMLEEIASDVVEARAHERNHTTPEQFSKVLEEHQRTNEILRLQIQLRNRINALRQPYVSRYLLDDLIQGHKAEIAAAVKRAGGALPQGLDGTLLLSHAAVRGLSLVDAAGHVLKEIRELRAALQATEQMKDAALSRIASLTSWDDVRAAELFIEKLDLSGLAAPLDAETTLHG